MIVRWDEYPGDERQHEAFLCMIRQLRPLYRPYRPANQLVFFIFLYFCGTIFIENLEGDYK